MRTYPLAILTPTIGLPSETFIRRHIEEVCPDRTVVISEAMAHKGEFWTTAVPALVLKDFQPGIVVRSTRYLARRLGAALPPLEVGAVRRFLLEHGVKVVLGEWLHCSHVWFKVVKDLGIKFFAHAHGSDISEALRDPIWPRAYLDYNESAGIITMSRASKERLVALGLRPELIHVAPYGVNVLPELVSRDPGAKVTCLAIGRMVNKKAPILLLDAFRRAAAKCPQLCLEYVGGGPLLGAAIQYVRASGLDGRVTFHGPKPHSFILQKLKEADIFLQHSITDPETGDEEGLPVAILEAMGHGIAVIATRHAGIPEAVIEGQTGLLVDEWDTKRMADCIVELAADPSQRSRMGVNSWQRAREHFSAERECTDLRRIIGLQPESR